MVLVDTPRLVATDLDGTLLNFDGHLTERSRGVLQALDERDVPVVFVTGRPLRWMDYLWEEVGDHGIAICSNGAILYDVASHSVRQALTIDTAHLLGICDELRAQLPGTTFALESVSGIAREDGFGTPDPAPDSTAVGELTDIVGDDVIKVLALHQDREPEEFWEEVGAIVGERLTTTWSSSFAMVEMSLAGVTKAATLAQVCDELGVAAADVIAFGDMHNDIPMLEWAGQAYAMSGAHRDVVAAAQHTAPTNTEDGVAQVLSDVFGLSA